MGLLRYDSSNVIGTDLDPIEDVLNLITSLKSKGFTTDLLKEVHNFTDASEIKRTSKLIGYHVDNAVNLANQAIEGPAIPSFLPLYYSALNITKIHLLILGKRDELERNRRHGAGYKEREMRKNFLNEQIEIYRRGTIPNPDSAVLNIEV